jgi:hypothetical protein
MVVVVVVVVVVVAAAAAAVVGLSTAKWTVFDHHAETDDVSSL